MRKGTGKYEVRIRNAGTKADRFKLKLAKRSGYTIKVMAGKKNVTKLVLKGTYRTAFSRRGQDAHAQADDSREEEGLVQADRHVGRGREGAVDGDSAIPAVSTR